MDSFGRSAGDAVRSLFTYPWTHCVTDADSVTVNIKHGVDRSPRPKDSPMETLFTFIILVLAFIAGVTFGFIAFVVVFLIGVFIQRRMKKKENDRQELLQELRKLQK